MLSSEQIEHYQRQGFVFPLRAFDSDESEVLLSRLDGVDEVAVANVINPWYYKSYLLFTWLNEVVRNEKILDAVQDLIGDDIVCFSCDIWRKCAHETRHISWHQDASYWRLSPPDIVTAWIALTPARPGNGCMRFLPGSHHSGLISHTDTFAPDNLLSHGQVVDLTIEESEVVDIELRAGEFSLHHCLLAHASAPNPSATDRVGLCIRYAPGVLRQLDGPPVSAMTVRGRAHGNLIAETAPISDLSEQAVAQHNRLLSPHAETLYTRF